MTKKPGVPVLILISLIFLTSFALRQDELADYTNAISNQDPDQRIQKLEAFVAKYPESINVKFAYFQLAVDYLNVKKDCSKSLEYAKKAEEYINELQNGQKVQVYLIAANCSLVLKNKQQARAYVDKAMQVYEANKSQQGWDRILNAINQLKAQTEEPRETTAQKALRLYREGKTAEALPLFKQVFAEKKDGRVAKNIAIILNKQGEFNEAVKYFLYAGFLRGEQEDIDTAQSLFLSKYTDPETKKNYNDMVQEVTNLNNRIGQLQEAWNNKWADKELTEEEEAQANTELEQVNNQVAGLQKGIASWQARQKKAVDAYADVVAQVKKELGIQ